jgi:hypothetical protein
MGDEDFINRRLRAVLKLLNGTPLPPPEEGERMLKEVTRMLEDPKLLQAAAQMRKSRAQ